MIQSVNKKMKVFFPSFTVRVMVKASDKIGGSLVDAEIAGQRTLISYRPDLTVRRMGFETVTSFRGGRGGCPSARK